MSRGTTYTILNDYPGDDDVFIYYTLDGSDPTVSATRTLYQGETLTVDGTTQVRTAYYHACGRCASCKAGKPLECLNHLFGEVGTYRYTVPTDAGGGGGGGGGAGGGAVVSGPLHVDALSTNEGEVDTNISVAKSADTIIVTPTPAPGYRVATVVATTESGVRIPVTLGTDGVYRFIMPGENVVVRGIFVEDVAPLSETCVDRMLNTDDHVLYYIGYVDGTVRPLNSIARCEAAMILYRLLLQPNVEKTVHFTDVPDNRWYSEAVNTLASLGIINGYTDGSFRPFEMIRRAEFTAMAVRFAKTASGSVRFKDVPESYWAASVISTAGSYGWIKGYGDDTFRPENEITRVEAAKVLNRMLIRTADREYVAEHFDELAQFSDLQDSGRWYFYDMVEATNRHSYTRLNGAEVWEIQAGADHGSTASATQG